LDALLVALEGSALGQLMRTSGVWAYGVVNLLHIVSVATLFGAVLLLDLRLLGAWPSVPLAAIERPTLTLAGAGFVAAVLTGACLIATNATEYYGNPFLLAKFAAIGLGLANVAGVQFLPAWRRRHETAPSVGVRRALALVGAVSLGCWLAAVAAGRMIGYW
jgi:hypothetical protein